jgi:CHAT domain-containing protein
MLRSKMSYLWRVDDDAAAALMQAFYRNLRTGTGPAQAMQMVALKVRKKYPHPYYWAAFVTEGTF